MAGRHKVDIVAALPLQAEHHAGQLFRLHLLPHANLADLIVLAVLAGQVAPGEKDGARSAPSHQGRLLAKVRSIARDDGPLAGVATRALRAQTAIHAALAGAEVAGFQAGVRICHPALQLARAVQLQVRRFELFCQDDTAFPRLPTFWRRAARPYQLTGTVFSR